MMHFDPKFVEGRATAPLTQEVLRELLDYDPWTGWLTWKVRPSNFMPSGSSRSVEWKTNQWNSRYAGKRAFTYVTPNNRAYQGAILGISFLAHRVIWCWWYGYWPEHEIDHIDGNPLNNAIWNLRDVRHVKNAKNQRLRNTNRTGQMGVSWDAKRRKYEAKITVNYKQKSLGRFESFEEAKSARLKAEKEYKFHMNHGNMTLEEIHG